MAKKQNNSRSCPWCGEEIRRTAIICRFCYHDVTDRGVELAGRFAAGEAPPELKIDPDKMKRVLNRDDVQSPGMQRLQRFVPQSLLDGLIDSVEEASVGERRPIAILFSDIVGFTSMTEQLGAETMSDLLDEVYKGTRDVIARYDGLVDKFIGDAVMALFGAPRAHGDDPERAIRAALDIRQVVLDVGRRNNYKLDTHAGVAFGQVVFKRIRGEGRLDIQTIGDAVNLASRLEGKAAAGEVIVDHRTYLQTRTTFEWEDLEPFKPKGKSMLIQSHKIMGVRKHFSKIDLGERISMTPLVGRRSDLKKLLAAANSAADGKLSVAVVRGDAGIGKSRLVYECYQKIDKERFAWFTGRCLSFGSSIPFLPFKSLLRIVLGFPAEAESAIDFPSLKKAVDETLDSARKAVRSSRKKSKITSSTRDIFDALSFILGIPNAKSRLLKLPPRERRNEIFASIAQLFELLSYSRPLILVLEDFHWADEDSLYLLDFLIEKLRKRSVSIVLNARPEFDHTLPLPEIITDIHLSELSDAESARLLQQLTGAARLPVRLRDLIVVKTEGNPFYMEEVILNLLEKGMLEKSGDRYKLTCSIDELEIPDTVEGVVLARIDLLERRVRSILQCASVIGQEFRYRMLVQVSEITQRLRDHLITLVDGDYVFEGSLAEELEYIFRHIVLRDVAYTTLLEKHRRQFHARVAQALELLFEEHLEEYYEIVAHHYERGQKWNKAVDYLEKSAIKCEGLYAQNAAADHWKRLISALAKCSLPDDDVARMRLRARLRLGELCRRLGMPKRSIEEFTQACDEARSLNETAQLTRALLGLGEARRLVGKIDEAAHLIDEATSLAAKVGDAELIASSYNFAGHIERMRGQFADARHAFTKVLRIAEKNGLLRRRYQALNHLGIIDLYFGKSDRARERFEEALDVARELGLKNEQVQISMNIALCLLRAGEGDDAVSRLADALSLAEKIEFERGAQLILLMLTDTFLKLGRFREALATSRRLAKRLKVHSFSDVAAMERSNRARALVGVGKWNEAKTHIDEALKHARAEENYVVEIDALAALVEWQLLRSKSLAALNTSGELLERIEKSGELEFLSMAQTLRARALITTGNEDDLRSAVELSRSAMQTARKAGIVRDEAWGTWTLALALQEIGRASQAENYLAKARELAVHAGDAALLDLLGA